MDKELQREPEMKNESENKQDEQCIDFDAETCRFGLKGINDKIIHNLAETLDAPLSVILQVTRRCHFNCVFCSERKDISDPPFSQLEKMAVNLEGTKRIFYLGESL